MCVFAYMKSPALYVKSRKTHSVCSIKVNIVIDGVLSEHFKLDEFIKTQKGDYYIKANKKYAMEEENYLKLKRLCTDILEPIRKYLNKGNNAADVGINISSGMRCPELNALIKGSETSQHMYCEAADIVISGYNVSSKAHKDALVQLFKDLYNNNIEELNRGMISQCIIEKHKSYWLHIGIKSERKKFITKFMISPNVSPRPYNEYKGTDSEFDIHGF